VQVNAPELTDVLERVGEVKSSLYGTTRTISEWRQQYLRGVERARQASEIEVFGRFVGGGLLEVAMLGEAYERRIEKFPSFFRSYDDISEGRVQEFLRAVRYRFPPAGLAVVMKAKDIVTAPGFSWPRYFEEAERHYREDFPDDTFRRIKHVGYKTRDLGLSEFSTSFVAMDLHVTRVTARTGLLLHGYGDPDITTNQLTERGYLFLHRLLLRLSESTGWPDGGYSPGEIDRMFWYFGRALCGARPRCSTCPLARVCVTATRGRE